MQCLPLLSPKFKKKTILFRTILLGSFQICIQEFWCQSAAKMFQQMLNRLIEEKLMTSPQAEAELTQYRHFISEAKKYHHNKFASYSFAQERLDKFLG